MEPSFNEYEAKRGLKSGWGVAFGLCLTFLLHLTQLAVIFIGSFLPGNVREKLSLVVVCFFGFIQLSYIVPAILYFRRRDYDKVVIGLIIGASLTFVLGLPLAGLYTYCAATEDGFFK